MSQTLFRPESIENQKNRLLGEVLITQPLNHRIVFSLVFVVFILIIFIFYFSKFSTNKIAYGYVLPESGMYKIIAPESGVIERIDVVEGALVKKGSTLIVLRKSTYLKSGSTLTNEIISGYLVERNTLVDQVSRNVKLNGIAISNLDIKRKYLEQEITINKKRSIITDEMLFLIDGQLDSISRLAVKGLASKSEEMQLQEKRLTTLITKSDLMITELNLRKQIETIGTDSMLLEYQQKNDLDSMKIRINDLENKISITEGSDLTYVNASKDGYISNLNVEEGQYLAKDTSLLSIYPNTSNLELTILIPSELISFVHEGQDIHVEFDAFDSKKYGKKIGRILNISKNSYLPHEILEAPISIISPMYVAKAQLSSYVFEIDGRDVHVRNGMTFTAAFAVKKGSLYQWIFDPLLN